MLSTSLLCCCLLFAVCCLLFAVFVCLCTGVVFLTCTELRMPRQIMMFTPGLRVWQTDVCLCRSTCSLSQESVQEQIFYAVADMASLIIDH